MLYQHTIEMRIVFTHYTFIDISLLIFVFIISFFFFFLFVYFMFFFFFFQAEDGIRDGTVTGVQTCALPISEGMPFVHRAWMMATRYERRQSSTPLPSLDPRWLDSAIEADAADLVCKLARPGHEATNRFLSDRLEKLKQPHEVQEVLRTMVRIKHPGAADAVIDVLKKLGKDKYYYYVGYWYGPMIAGLPKSALPKVDQPCRR